MKIGLMGFDFASSNKGCEALTFSFINMLTDYLWRGQFENYQFFCWQYFALTGYTCLSIRDDIVRKSANILDFLESVL